MKSQANRTRMQRLIAGVGTLTLVGAAACASTVDKSPPEEEGTAQQPAAQELKSPRARHHRSSVSVIIDAARAKANLSAEQAQRLAVIETELTEDRAGRRAFGEKMRKSAVAVVRAGTADSDDFDKTVAEAVEAIEERTQKSSDALEEVHGILDADQRAAVAVVLRAHIDEKFGVKPEQERRKPDNFKRAAGRLMLSTFQIDKLKAMKKELLGEKQELRPSREELHKLVDAFEGDDFRKELNQFRMKKLAILHAKVAKAGERTDTVLQVFTPEQRELIADMILEGPRKVLLGDTPAEAQE
ncbi:MAG TPA: hypothetical protein PKA88_06045 [Polyangiaceae bacterium]|nr:hypothetical protein [Polyangiaceae bacterium]HMR74236.1 hypothetical protein [Polyangiaceae bacterium]